MSAADFRFLVPRFATMRESFVHGHLAFSSTYSRAAFLNDFPRPFGIIETCAPALKSCAVAGYTGRTYGAVEYIATTFHICCISLQTASADFAAALEN